MTPSGGIRAGAGRKKLPEGRKDGVLSVRLFPPDVETLKSYDSTAVTLTLLAQGLRLGAGNLPSLTDEEIDCLQQVFLGLVINILAIRLIKYEIEDIVHPGALSLSKKLYDLGDFEILALVLHYISFKERRIDHGI